MTKGHSKRDGKVYAAFDIKEKGTKPPVGYAYIGVHMIFGIKMENFQFKAHLVANGNKTGALSSLTYASVMSRESMRIALMLATQNRLQVKTSDVENAYLTTPTEEKLYTILGPEFGEYEGKTAVICQALYGAKSAGASFRNHLAKCMLSLDYESCKADPNMWIKELTKPRGIRNYGYILLYVDGALCVNHDAQSQLEKLDKFFKMKPGSIGDPDIYLGGKLTQFEIEDLAMGDSQIVWGLSPTIYVQIANVEEYLSKNFNEQKLPKKHAKSPFATN